MHLLQPTEFVYKKYNLLDKLVEKYPNAKWNWRCICEYISWDNIEKNLDKRLEWENVSRNPALTLDIIIKNIDKLVIYVEIAEIWKIFNYASTTWDFVEKNLDKPATRDFVPGGISGIAEQSPIWNWRRLCCVGPVT